MELNAESAQDPILFSDGRQVQKGGLRGLKYVKLALN